MDIWLPDGTWLLIPFPQVTNPVTHPPTPAAPRLMQLPESPYGWPQLQRLVLGCNSLIELPASITAMPQLKHLALDGNSLALLSPQLGQLSRLEQLLLQGNRLVSLPPSINQLRCLRTLNLRYRKGVGLDCRSDSAQHSLCSWQHTRALTGRLRVQQGVLL